MIGVSPSPALVLSLLYVKPMKYSVNDRSNDDSGRDQKDGAREERIHGREHIFAPVDVSSESGPMPVRIIDASRMESTQLNPARKW